MAVTLSLLLIVVLLLFGVPFWVTLGLGTFALLTSTQALPLTLIGEGLFEGVDSFALIAIPLFVLTGDVMVRSKLAYKLLNFAEAIQKLHGGRCEIGWLEDSYHMIHVDQERHKVAHMTADFFGAPHVAAAVVPEEMTA